MVVAMKNLKLPALALLLFGCGPNDTDPGPGGVTVAEARALDEAAEMIEQRRLPPEAMEATKNAEAPAPADSEQASLPGQPE